MTANVIVMSFSAIQINKTYIYMKLVCGKMMCLAYC